MSKYLIACVLSFLMAISVQSISTAQNDQAAVKDSTTQETISTAPVKDSTAQEITSTEPITGVTIPAGTKFKVNINMSLSNSRNVAGSSFTAILEADFVFDEKIISPKGSQVIGKIVESKGGQGIGDSKLSFQFTDITVNKQLTPIVTDPIEVKGGRSRKDEVKIAAGTIEEVPLKKALVIK
jgi:hypothetical protein